MSIGINDGLLRNIAGNPECGFFSYDKGNDNEGRLLGKLDGKDIYLVPWNQDQGNIQAPANEVIRKKFLNAVLGEDLIKNNKAALDQIRRKLGLPGNGAAEAQKPLKAFKFAKVLQGVENFGKWKNLYETKYKGKGYTFDQFSKALKAGGGFELDEKKPDYANIKYNDDMAKGIQNKLDNVVHDAIHAQLGTERELRKNLGLPAEGDANGAQPKAMELLNKLNAFRNKTTPADLKALQALKSEYVEYQANVFVNGKTKEINDFVNELVASDKGKNFAGMENLKERIAATLVAVIKKKAIEKLAGDFKDFHTAPDPETLKKALAEAKSRDRGLWMETMASIHDNFKDQGLHKVALKKNLDRSHFPNPSLARLFGKNKEVCGDLLTALQDDKNVTVSSLLSGFGKLSEMVEKYKEKYNSIAGISQKIDSDQAMKDLVGLGLLSSGKAFAPSTEGKKVLATCIKEMEKYVYSMNAQIEKYQGNPKVQKILDNAQKELRLLKSFARLAGVSEGDYAFEFKPGEKLVGNVDVNRYLESKKASFFHLSYLGDLQKKECAEVGKGYVDFINKQLAEVPRNAQDRKYVDFSRNLDKMLGHDGITWKKGDAVLERNRQEDTAGVPRQIKDFFAKDQAHGAQASYALGTILNQDQLAEMKKLQKETGQPFKNDFTAENPTLDFKVRRMKDGSYQIETKLSASLKTMQSDGKDMPLDPANSRIAYTSVMKLTFDQNGNPKLEMIKPVEVDYKLMPSALPADALKRLAGIKDPKTNELLAKNAVWDNELLSNPKLIGLLGKKNNDKDIVKFLKRHAITADDEAYLVGMGLSRQEMQHLIHGTDKVKALSSKLVKALRSKKDDVRQRALDILTERRKQLVEEGWNYPQGLKLDRAVLAALGGLRGSRNERFSDMRLLWDYMDTKDSGYDEDRFKRRILDKLVDSKPKVREEAKLALHERLVELRQKQGMKYLYFFSSEFSPADVALLENAKGQEAETVKAAMNALYNARDVYNKEDTDEPIEKLTQVLLKLRPAQPGAGNAGGVNGANPQDKNGLRDQELKLNLAEARGSEVGAQAPQEVKINLAEAQN